MLFAEFDPNQLWYAIFAAGAGLSAAGLGWFFKRVVEGNTGKIEDRINGVSTQLNLLSNQTTEIRVGFEYLKTDHERYREHLRKNMEHIAQLRVDVARLKGRHEAMEDNGTAELDCQT